MKVGALLSWFLLIFFVCFACQKRTNSTGLDKSEEKNDTLSPALKMSTPFIIDASEDGSERQFPFVYKFGDVILVSFSQHTDKVVASPTDALVVSRDNGITWGEKHQNKDFYFTSMVKIGKTLYGIVYFTYPVSSNAIKMIYWTSEDNGKSWQEHEGKVAPPLGKKFKAGGTSGIWGSLLFHRGMSVTDDGIVEGVMYGGGYENESGGTFWVQSKDSCKTWQIKSRISRGFAEPNVIRTEDNSLLCILRDNSYKPLYQCRSLDNGITWSKPIPLRGLSDSSAFSVDPQLLLTGDGKLLLTYGRPGTRLAMAVDGNGYHWDYYWETYQDATSGYSGIVEVERNRFLLISDKGANWESGASNRAIWGRFIDLKMKD